MKASFGPTGTVEAGAVCGGSTSPGAMVKFGHKFATFLSRFSLWLLGARMERVDLEQSLRMSAYNNCSQRWDEVPNIPKKKVNIHG